MASRDSLQCLEESVSDRSDHSDNHLSHGAHSQSKAQCQVCKLRQRKDGSERILRAAVPQSEPAQCRRQDGGGDCGEVVEETDVDVERVEQGAKGKYLT